MGLPNYLDWEQTGSEANPTYNGPTPFPGEQTTIQQPKPVATVFLGPKLAGHEA